jgi:6-phosphogluconolactonase
MPDPMPLDAPVPRVSLSLAAITAARSLLIAVRGDEKRAVIETAIRQGASSPYPVGRALAGTELPVDIHWAP